MHDPSSQAQAELSAAASWNAEDVAAWLVQNDLDRYSARFWENRVTGAALLGITYEDLRRLGVLNLKHRARILNAVAELKGSGVRLQPRSKSSGVLQTRSETCPSTTSNISPGPYSAPLPQDIPFGLLQHSDDTYFAPQPPIPPSSLRASLNVSSIPAIPPRTKSIEAFPVGWDARLSVPAHVLTSDHEEHAASTVIQFQELQFEEHKVMQELPPRLDSHLAPSLRIQSSYQQPPLFPAREDSLLDASPVDFAVVSPAGSAGHRTSCYEDDGHDLGFLPALINDGVFDDKLSDKSSEHNLYPDTRPTGRARANSSGALKRHPAIREHRSRSPLPQARESEVNRPIRRPHLAITTNLGMSHHHTSVTSLESPGSVGSKSSTVESLTREPQIKAVHVNDHSKMRSPNIEATKSLTDGSPMSPMSSSFRDGSFYEKDSIMGISSIRDRCIRVTGTDYQSHIIDVAALTNPEAIRERIYTKFNIQGDDEKEQYGIFSLDFSGNLDIENNLTDDVLLDICQSRNAHLKAHLILKKLDEPYPPSSPFPAAPEPQQELSEVPASPRSGRRRRAFRQFLSRLNSTEEVEPPPLMDIDVDVDTVPIKVSSDIPPLAPVDQDGFLPEDEVYSDTDYDTIGNGQGVIQNLDHFFGERPPTELICDNLENFFPSLTRSTTRASRRWQDNPDDPAPNTKSLKSYIRETMDRKRISKAGTMHSSFGRRTSTLQRSTAVPTVQEQSEDTESDAEQASIRETQRSAQTLTRQWHDLVALVKADATSVAEIADEVSGPLEFLSREKTLVEGVPAENDCERLSLVDKRRASDASEYEEGEANKPNSLPRLKRVWTQRSKPLTKRSSSASLSTRAHTKRLNAIDDHSNEVKSLDDRRRSQLPGDFSLKGENESKAFSPERKTHFGKEIGRKRHTVVFSEIVDRKGSQKSDMGPTLRKAYSQQLRVRTRPSAESLQQEKLEDVQTGEAASPTSIPLPPSPDLRSDEAPERNKPSSEDSAVVLDPAMVNEISATDEVKAVAAAAEVEEVFSDTQRLPRAFTIEPDTPRPVDWVCGPLIGKGSFGKVYYGVNVKTGEILAVKQVELANLPPRKTDDQGKKDVRRRMVDALHREITLLKDLDHENIVRYLGYDVQGKTINVFLEYVSGGSIASSIATMGRFEEPLVRSLTCQILCGLGYLHERSIIHRDIKGGNILLDENGVAKISDFGISKKNEYKLAYRFNSRMSLQGSVHWMAPEVIKGKGYSAKVDIWSLGCLILEMFTGYHPWQQLDELQTMWRLGKENAPPIPEWLSPEAQSFLAKCFAIDPDERPTAAELLCDPFADVDPASFLDFRAYKEAAIEQKRLEEEAESDESWDSAGGNWLRTRDSVRISRFQSTRRSTTRRSMQSKRSTISRRRPSETPSNLSDEVSQGAQITAPVKPANMVSVA